MNTWYIRILGTEFSAEFSTKFPRTLRVMEYGPGKEQAWQTIDIGYQPAYPTISGAIVEFGFTDTILQMWAAFCDELEHGRDEMLQPFYCVTPQETYMHHQILTAALLSHHQQQVSVI
jgi:hypothetical protein